MYKINKVIVMGNIVNDPVIAKIPKSNNEYSLVANFKIAINREYFAKSKGERVEEVVYVRITAWNKEAEQAQKFLKKGSTILIEGRLTNRPFKLDNGKKIDIVEITAEKFFFIKLKKNWIFEDKNDTMNIKIAFKESDNK